MISGPVAAAQCNYVNGGGDTVRFVENGENSVILAVKGRSPVGCSWALTPDSLAGADIVCADGTEGDYFFGAPALGGDGQGLLIFLGDIWYKRCYEPA